MRRGLGIALAVVGLLALSKLATRYLWPVSGGVLGSPFGTRKDPITGETRNHNGIDIKAERGKLILGSPVMAVDDGIIAHAGDTGGDSGIAVIMYLDDGTRVGYAHLRDVDVVKGQAVRRGEVIGHVGMTGRTTGPHLHLTMSRNDIYFDPAPYFT